MRIFMFSKFFKCCFSVQDEGYEKQYDPDSKEEQTILTHNPVTHPTEVSELLETERGKLALRKKFFTRAQAEQLGPDLIEDVLLTDNGIQAFTDNLITAEQLITLLDDLSKRSIPPIDVVTYLVSAKGQERLKSGELTLDKVPDEFAKTAIVLSP
jgi:hypothetical protein